MHLSKSGKIPTVKIGGSIRVNQEDLENFLKDGGVQVIVKIHLTLLPLNKPQEYLSSLELFSLRKGIRQRYNFKY